VIPPARILFLSESRLVPADHPDDLVIAVGPGPYPHSHLVSFTVVHPYLFPGSASSVVPGC
jgi:hypothetical protein